MTYLSNANKETGTRLAFIVLELFREAKKDGFELSPDFAAMLALQAWIKVCEEATNAS